MFTLLVNAVLARGVEGGQNVLHAVRRAGQGVRLPVRGRPPPGLG